MLQVQDRAWLPQAKRESPEGCWGSVESRGLEGQAWVIEPTEEQGQARPWRSCSDSMKRHCLLLIWVTVPGKRAEAKEAVSRFHRDTPGGEVRICLVWLRTIYCLSPRLTQ